MNIICFLSTRYKLRALLSALFLILSKIKPQTKSVQGSSNFTPQLKEARNQSQIVIGYRFHVTLRIVSPIILFKSLNA